jgi:hypothetical protein
MLLSRILGANAYRKPAVMSMPAFALVTLGFLQLRRF